MQIKKVHGVFSLTLVMLAFILGIVVVFMSSIIVGAVLAAILILFYIFIPKLVCAKCPSRENCGHVVLGKLSQTFSPYCVKNMGLGDLIVLVFFMVPLVVVPQFWLYKHLVFLIVYWALMLIGGADILLFVCPACGNIKCPLNKVFGKK